MSDPTATARQTPTGIRLPDGFGAKITFALDPDVDLFEVAGTPPPFDGGEPIDTTTNFNSLFKTKAAQQLIEVGNSSFRAGYDPTVYWTQLRNLINKETTVTFTFFDGTKLAFFGYLQKFEPTELVAGTMPLGNCTVVCTNSDPAAGHKRLEAGPTVDNVTGT